MIYYIEFYTKPSYTYQLIILFSLSAFNINHVSINVIKHKENYVAIKNICQYLIMLRKIFWLYISILNTIW